MTPRNFIFSIAPVFFWNSPIRQGWNNHNGKIQIGGNEDIGTYFFEKNPGHFILGLLSLSSQILEKTKLH